MDHPIYRETKASIQQDQQRQSAGFKLAAIGSVCKRAYVTFDSTSKLWRVVAEGIRTKTNDVKWEGDTPESAIEEAWFWLTHHPKDGFCGRFVMPFEQQAVIVTKGRKETWYRWDGFRWVDFLTQRA